MSGKGRRDWRKVVGTKEAGCGKLGGHWRQLRRTDGDGQKQVEDGRSRREETAQKKWMVAVQEEERKEEEGRAVGRGCVSTRILMMGKVLLVFLHQWKNI